MGEENINEGIWTSSRAIWGITTNQELWELYKDLDIVADIKERRLEWIGHLVRMDHGSVVKIFESIPEERRMRRPRLRWLKHPEKDLWEMKVKRW
jgi:hypothetical protein